MSKLAVLALSLAACAAANTAIDPTPSHGTKVRLDLATMPTDGARSAFPAAIEPTVPSIDRISYSVRQVLGTTASAQLDLCVSPTGKVTRAALAKTSTFDAFDQALVRDALGWDFETRPGPATLQSCRRTTIQYNMR